MYYGYDFTGSLTFYSVTKLKYQIYGCIQNYSSHMVSPRLINYVDYSTPKYFWWEKTGSFAQRLLLPTFKWKVGGGLA